MTDYDINRWMTPRPLFDGISADEGPYQLDAAADAENTLCHQWHDKKANGRAQPWLDRTWCNPPYNPKGEVTEWLLWALEQLRLGRRSTLLIPGSVETTWFADIVRPNARWQLFRGRIKFVDPRTGTPPRMAPRQANALVHFDGTTGFDGWRDSATGVRL